MNEDGPRYRSNTVVKAVPMTRQAYNTFRGWPLPADENGEDEGYLLEREDGSLANTPTYEGYISWLPKHVFERNYEQI